MVDRMRPGSTCRHREEGHPRQACNGGAACQHAVGIDGVIRRPANATRNSTPLLGHLASEMLRGPGARHPDVDRDAPRLGRSACASRIRHACCHTRTKATRNVAGRIGSP